MYDREKPEKEVVLRVKMVKLKNKWEGSHTRVKSFPLADTYIISLFEVSFSIASVMRRNDRIRTCDFEVPNFAAYHLRTFRYFIILSHIYSLCKLAGVTGLEPAIYGFGDRCSNQLNHTPRRHEK